MVFLVLFKYSYSVLRLSKIISYISRTMEIKLGCCPQTITLKEHTVSTLKMSSDQLTIVFSKRKRQDPSITAVKTFGNISLFSHYLLQSAFYQCSSSPSADREANAPGGDVSCSECQGRDQNPFFSPNWQLDPPCCTLETMPAQSKHLLKSYLSKTGLILSAFF